MAVYTQVNDSDLAAFLDDYEVGHAVSFKGIAEGVENSNYFLQTSQASFILTIYEKRANADDLPYFLNMMEHLAGQGLPSPLPVKDRYGETLKTLLGKPACLITFLTGVSVDDPTPDHCAALGDMLAKMHLALSDFQTERSNDLSIMGWQGLAKQTMDRADETKSGLGNIIAEELDFLARHWPATLPKGTIHADLFADNVLFHGHDITGVIDFYFGCTDFLAYDIAVCINAWAFSSDHEFVPERAKRLCERYDLVRRLSADEINALPILCRGAALRFLLTRLYDMQNQVAGAVVSVKDPLDYLKRLKFHQSAKGASDYVFETR